MKAIYWIGLLVLCLNLTIYLVRKQGFDYKDYTNKEVVYNTNLFQGWSFEFSEDQLSKAKKLLVDTLNIDTCQTDLDKLLVIDNFLYYSICENHILGPLNEEIIDPFTLFTELKQNRNLPFQCGQAQYLQAFFCAAVGIKTRLIQNIQKPNLKIAPDSHVYSEVWLKEKNQWVISDFYQNRHLIEKDGSCLTAVEYYDASLKKKLPGLKMYYTDSFSIHQDVDTIADPYFSSNYQLAFFEETDPAIVYYWQNKIQHYLFDYSHYKTYDPQVEQPNCRHRIKQVAILSWCIWLVIFIASIIKKQVDRGKKHTEIL